MTGRLTSAILLFGCTVMLLGSSCRRDHAFGYPYKSEPDPRKGGFVLGASDELQITVWKNAALSTSIRIRPDGIITMPLIGDIEAAGRTPTELKKEIQKRLSDFIRDQGAVVTVAVTAVNSYHFTVSGSVGRPGLYTATRYVTLQEGVAMAGGPTRFAELGRIYVVRTQPKRRGSPKPKRERRIPINFERVAKGKAPEQNLVLLPGDVVFVP